MKEQSDPFCPLLSSSLPLSEDEVKWIPCQKNKCAWFRQVTGRPEGVGNCSIYLLASSAEKLLEDVKKQI